LFAFLKQKNILAIQYIIQMADTIILERSMETPADNTSPFTRKEVVKIKDMSTSGNYSTGQVVFETISLSNGGKWCDYTEAYITIPTVSVMTGVAANGAVVNFTEDHVKDSDMALVFKNSHLNLINSCQIDYGNRSAVQQTDHINDYLIFKQHTELSAQDEELHGPTIGYAKDDSRSWYWDAGNGIGNNKVGSGVDVLYRHSAAVNRGMFNRSQVYFAVDDNDGETTETISKRHHIFGADAVKQSNRSYIVNHAEHKAYYHNVIVRLKDLPLFQSMPSLLKGGNFKITLTLNQCEFRFSIAADGEAAMGAMAYDSGSFTGKLTNPLMVSANSFSIVKLGDAMHQTAKGISAGGSWSLPASRTYTVSCNVARPQYPAHQGKNVADCQSLNCELNVPVYDLKPAIESRYLQMGQKKVVYNEVLLHQLLNKQAGSTFNDLITNGLTHMKRLIIIPTIASGSNGTALVDPRMSPFDTVPSTCSPYILENLQVQIANQNVYANPVNYSYEMFLQEMNGRYGVESSLFAGVSSSRISMQDYIELYGYIVVDLKRKYSSDESVPLSVSISGKIKSLKNLDLYCFIEQEKTMTIDVATGQRLS
jgi:hypothetical protein